MADTSDLLLQGIQAARAGDNAKARKLLIQVVHVDSDNAWAWLWLSKVVDDDQKRKDCLRQVLRIEPDNQSAREAMAELTGQKPPAPVVEPEPDWGFDFGAEPDPAPQPAPVQKPSGQPVEDDLLDGVSMFFAEDEEEAEETGGFALPDDDFRSNFFGDDDEEEDAPEPAPAPRPASVSRRPRLITLPTEPPPAAREAAPSSAASLEAELLAPASADEEKRGVLKRALALPGKLLKRRKRKAPEDTEPEAAPPKAASPMAEMIDETPPPTRRRFKLLETRALFGVLGLPVILGLLAYYFVVLQPGTPVPTEGGLEITIGPECRDFDFSRFVPETATENLGGALAADTIFSANQTYRVAQTLVVPEGRGLLIEPGARVLFAEGAALDVRGGLYVCGAARRIVTLSAANETPGGWEGLRLRNPAGDTLISHAEIAYAGNRALRLEGRPPRLAHVTIRDSRLFPISVDGNALPVLERVDVARNPFKGIEVRGGTLTAEQIAWPADFVYIVTGPLRVADTATLEIAPGAVVKFWQPGEGQIPGLRVEGLLKAAGVSFTSAYDSRETVGGVTYLEAWDPQPGDWGGITFAGSSERSYLRESLVAYAGNRQPAITVQNSAPEVMTVTVAHGASYPMRVDIDAFPTLHNLLFVDNVPGDALEMRGGIISGRETRTWEYITAPGGQVTRVVRGVIVVDDEATLSIAAGVVLKFEPQGKLVVQGTLNAVGGGTAASKIVFTSLYDDRHGGATVQGTSPRDTRAWGGVVLDGLDRASVLQNSIVRYAPLWILDGAPRVNTLDVQESDRAAIYITPNATPEMRGLNLTDNARNGMVVLGGDIAQDHVWPLLGERESQVVRILQDNVTVVEGVTLRLGAGVVVKGSPGSRLTVLGGLRAPGEVHLPVIFTSLRDGSVGGATTRGLTEALPGDWYGLILGPQADARLSHTSIYYARYGLTLRDGAMPTVPDGRLVISQGEHALWCDARAVIPEAFLIEGNRVNETRCPAQ